MKISLNPIEFEKCKKLIEVKNMNISAAEYYIDFLSYHPIDIKSAINEKDWFKKFNEIEQIPAKIIHNSNMDKVTKLDPKTFEENSYYKTIKNLKICGNCWEFCNLCYEKYEGFVSGEITVNPENFAEHTPISYFENSYKYLAVLENDEIWMSIIPHEINTMKDPIKNAFGNVLVFGLGLGYFVFQIASKPNVKKITVIENDIRIIKMFNENLLNFFPHKEKINIVLGDALSYIKNSKQQFDYVFSDIWHNVGDGEMLYLKLKSQEKYQPNAKYDYWIETSILAMLRRRVLIVFEEALEKVDTSVYQKAENNSDLIINKIYYFYKDYQIKNFNDLYSILTDESLKLMALKLF